MNKNTTIRNNLKTISEAVELIPKMKKTKFTSSIDLDIVLNLKEKHLKETLQGSVTIPHKFGEDKKIVVLCDPAKSSEAISAGAIAAGLDDIIKKITDNKIKFDIVLATPEVMPKIVRLGKVLGPKGLMPNPRNGTIINNLKKDVESFKSGRVNFKMEAGQGVVRGKIATTNMKSEEIKENMIAYLKEVVSEAKKLTPQPLKKVIMTTTMGTGVKLDINDIIANI